MPKPQRNKKEQREIALERIKLLFNQAEQIKSNSLAQRYVSLARKIAMKTKIKLPRELKRRFCQHCYSYLNSSNSRRRVYRGKVIISCLHCKKFMRIPLK